MASMSKPTGGGGFSSHGSPNDFENNGELPPYLVGSDAENLGRRPPLATVSPLPSPFLGSLAMTPPVLTAQVFQASPISQSMGYGGGGSVANSNAWREGTEEMRRLRARNVILVERMLSNHQPHDVLTQVPENFNWHSKTFTLAIKIERLMFASATSRENYLDESTLRSRVQLLSRHLVRIRKRKNAMATAYTTSA
jgi:hypothetical protein